MKRGKRAALFMIVAGQRDKKGVGSRYVTTDGAVTSLRSRAAKFTSASDAKTFANLHEVRLGNGLYIGKRKPY